jgi:hypothetical protein
MLHRVSIKVSAEDVGAAFAHADAQSQAEMLNAMGKILMGFCGSDMGMQACFISNHIDDFGEKLIKELNSFINYRKAESRIDWEAIKSQCP